MAASGETACTITIDRNALMRAMAHLARVVEKRTTIPILNNVRLSASEGPLTLTATDLDIEARVDVDCEVSGSGDITVPAGTMNDIVRKIAEGAPAVISWDANSTTVTLHSGRSRFSLQAMPARDFPDMNAGDFSHRFTMPAAALLALIEATSFAISTDETRYYLNGIYLHCPTDGESGSVLRGVATDGHRLARFDVPSPEGASGMQGIIVPRKTVNEIARIASTAMDKNGEGVVKIEVSTSKIRVSAGAVVLTSKLIDGTFPAYQRVIPTGNNTRALLSRDTLASAVDRVAMMASAESRAMKLGFDNNKLLISVVNPSAGSAEEEIEAEYSDGAFEAGVNARYLADILAALHGDTVLIKFGGPGSPLLFQKPADDNHLIVLMLLRV